MNMRLSLLSTICLANLWMLSMAAVLAHADEAQQSATEFKRPVIIAQSSEPTPTLAVPDQKDWVAAPRRDEPQPLRIGGAHSRVTPNTQRANGITFQNPPRSRQSSRRAEVLRLGSQSSQNASTSTPSSGFQFEDRRSDLPQRRASTQTLSLTIDGSVNGSASGNTVQGITFHDSGASDPTAATAATTDPESVVASPSTPSTPSVESTPAAEHAMPGILIPIRQRNVAITNITAPEPEPLSTPPVETPASAEVEGVVTIPVLGVADVQSPDHLAVDDTSGTTDVLESPSQLAPAPIEILESGAASPDIAIEEWAVSEATPEASASGAEIDWRAPPEQLVAPPESEATWWTQSDRSTAGVDSTDVVSTLPELDLNRYITLATQQMLLPVSIAFSEKNFTEHAPELDTLPQTPAVHLSEPALLGDATDTFMPAAVEPDIRPTSPGTAKPNSAGRIGVTDMGIPMGPGRASRPLTPLQNAAFSVESPSLSNASSKPGPVSQPDSIALAALLDDLEPLAPGGPQLPGEAQALEPPAADSTTDEETAEQTLGEAPEESDQPLQFLRRQTVLLEPGAHQFDIGISYLNDSSDFPTLITDGVNVAVVEGQTQQRLLVVPMELRVGVSKYTQGFINVPIGWSNSEVAFNGDEFVNDVGGIGDISAGLTKQVVIGNEYYPDVLASVAVSAPTGNSSLTTALSTPGSALGQGFWTLTGALSFIQTYDPVVFFYGLGYTFRFQDDFGNDIEIDPGDQIFYRFGAGFAVNPHVTLSAAFTGSFIGRDEINDIEAAGSIREPMSIRLAATISRRKSSKTHNSFKLVEPFVNFGLNEDSVDAIVGISWTH